MANVFVNGLKLKTGGGRNILTNYLSQLKGSEPGNTFFVLTPDKKEYSRYACELVEIIDVSNLVKPNMFFPSLYYFAIPRLLKYYKIDVIFNLGDIVIPTHVPQLYLFDWAYALYPDSVAWKRLNLRGYFSRKAKSFLIRKYIRKAAIVIAQTTTMRDALIRAYGIRNVEVIPNALSLDNLSGGQPYDYALPKDRTKLLYLSTYSPHKNLEILLPVAGKIRDLNLPFCIVITIDPDEHPSAKPFLRRIKEDQVDSVILNMGHVAMDYVPTLYDQCDALLMPTLLESYGNQYVEAMYHNKTIITSDLDFARAVCGDAAFYCDPLDENSILATITQAFSDNEVKSAKIEEGERRIRQLLTWKQACARYHELLERCMGKRDN